MSRGISLARPGRRVAAALAVLLPAFAPRAADAPAAAGPDAQLARLSLPEKVTLMSGGSMFGTAAIPRAGIPALRFADGPTGVRSNNDEPATVFPTGTALAATWNEPLAAQVGSAIGEEARALGIHVVLGPNVNLQRSPLAGRNFEAYSEDPVLSGRIGIGFVRGVQARGVGTSPKHYVANEQELERLRGSSNVDERTLRELYLRPFEMIVREAQPWTAMASYNRVNGRYVTEDARLLRGILKGEWGFDGVLMSDWTAVRSVAAAANAGVDLEMPGPPRRWGPALVDAVRHWEVEPSVVDDAARRMLRLVERTGAAAQPSAPDGPPPRRDAGSERHRDVAFRAAAEGLVLLKNDGALLPLQATSLRRLAVIGPNADVPLQQGGGSSNVIPSRQRTPLDALRERLGPGVAVVAEAGVDNDRVAPPVDPRWLSPDRARRQQGLAARYWAGPRAAGTPVYEGIDTYFDKLILGEALPEMAARWEGWFWPPRDGEYEFRIAARGTATLTLDGRVLLTESRGTLLPAESEIQSPSRFARISLRAGRAYPLRLDYVAAPGGFHQMHLAVRPPAPSFGAAVAAARGADAAIVFVGVSRTSETEGRDRVDLNLAGRQDELVDAVLAANPRTIVVLNNGGPLSLPWVGRVPAILEAWLPGQEGADAIAATLLGEVNPSGRLPFTFPKRIEDTPAWLYYSGGRDANYGEGVFVGYRYYDRRGLEPLFAFGHGLSYTKFEYSNLRVSAPDGDDGPVTVTVDLRNTGTRAGAEVVQVYVGDHATTDVVRPPRELRAFAKAALTPGEMRSLRFSLAPRDFAYYDVHARAWTVTPGEYAVSVGASSADLRGTATLRRRAFRDAGHVPP